MQILHPFAGSIQHYLDEIADPDRYRPAGRHAFGKLCYECGRAFVRGDPAKMPLGVRPGWPTHSFSGTIRLVAALPLRQRNIFAALVEGTRRRARASTRAELCVSRLIAGAQACWAVQAPLPHMSD